MILFITLIIIEQENFFRDPLKFRTEKVEKERNGKTDRGMVSPSVEIYSDQFLKLTLVLVSLVSHVHVDVPVHTR